jgi:hypothetical protein
MLGAAGGCCCRFMIFEKDTWVPGAVDALQRVIIVLPFLQNTSLSADTMAILINLSSQADKDTVNRLATPAMLEQQHTQERFSQQRSVKHEAKA